MRISPLYAVAARGFPPPCTPNRGSMAQQVAPEAAFQLPGLRGVPAWGNSLPPGHAGRGWEMEKLRPEMVSFVFGPSVPDPKRGVGRLGPESLSATPIRRLAHSCPCGADYRQIGFIHGHAGGGYAVRPEHAHMGVRGLSMPQSRHTTSAFDRAGWGRGHGTAWLLVLV